MKTGVIDVGGGFRGVYACGVLDRCLDEDVRFDLALGVSAGSANLASFAAGQRGRNYRFYMDYSQRKRYASMRNFLTKHSYIDLDYVYSTLSNADGEDPLDYVAIRDNAMELVVVAANAVTGEVKYFDKRDIAQDDYAVFKASSAIPFICKPYAVRGVPYFDGALGDPVPVERAFSLGCDKVVLILTKPESTIRTPEKDERLAARISRRYPQAAQALRQRAARYNEGVAFAQQQAAQGRVLIIAPDDTCGVDTLTRDKTALERLYEKGYDDARKIAAFVQE